MKSFARTIRRKIRAFGIALKRVQAALAPRIRPFPGNRPSNRKWALLSYLPDAVSMKDSDPRMKSHSNWWECREIARILCDLGYNVEAISARDTKTIPDRRYDLVIDLARNLQRLAPYQKPTTKYALLLTGSHYSWSVEAERKRVAAFEKTHGVRYALRYGAMPTALLDKSLEIADLAMSIGDETTLSTYPEWAHGKIVRIPATPSFCPFRKTYRKLNRSFLFFSGPCNVLKGLDLALDAFLRHPEWTLHVVGRQQSERDFMAAYPDIGKATNIRFHGFMAPDSEAFGRLIDECDAFLAPTCTEGASTSAILLGEAGLFAIASDRLGVDYPPKTLERVDSLTPEGVGTAIERFLSRPLSDIARKAEESRTALAAVFSRENFTRTLSGILRRLEAAPEDRNAPERP